MVHIMCKGACVKYAIHTDEYIYYSSICVQLKPIRVCFLRAHDDITRAYICMLAISYVICACAYFLWVFESVWEGVYASICALRLLSVQSGAKFRADIFRCAAHTFARERACV